jgi:hypothetical protein
MLITKTNFFIWHGIILRTEIDSSNDIIHSIGFTSIKYSPSNSFLQDTEHMAIAKKRKLLFKI